MVFIHQRIYGRCQFIDRRNIMLDEEKLIEEAREHFEEFLQKELRSLASFTGDSSLNYIPDANLKGFVLKPKEAILYLPLAQFLNRDLDENQIMWHIYNELALYSDWKREARKYLGRRQDWQKEIDSMTGYILERIKKEGLEEDPAYKPGIISNYVGREILSLLYKLDKYTAFLRVLQLCPIYRDRENFKQIMDYLSKEKRIRKSPSPIPKHRLLVNGFLDFEVYGDKLMEQEDIREIHSRKIFNQPFFEFIRHELVRQINQGEGIIKRDPFIQSFIYPTFEELWKEEIDEMEFYQSEGKKEGEGRGEGDFQQAMEDEEADSLESNEEEVEKILNEFLELENEMPTNIEDIMEARPDLRSYGISQGEEELFWYYSNQMKKEREEMRQFWMKLIGDAKREVNVKKDLQLKGKLDIDNFINCYPDFLEAEKKGNYQSLPIFNRYLLESQANILPERIEISFVIDNSGSMNQSKIEAARKALAVTLLSIDDFNKYLKNNREQLNQKIQVLSETWFFGSSYYNVKEFNDKNSKEKQKSDIIRSIVKLDATGGVTDDASCLREISSGITAKQERELKLGKQIKLIFLITDGASSFPGSSKEAIQDLLSKGVELYGFQIGKNSEANERVFNFVWNDRYKEPRGIIIGEEVEKLPKELLKAIRKNMNAIFD